MWERPIHKCFHRPIGANRGVNTGWRVVLQEKFRSAIAGSQVSLGTRMSVTIEKDMDHTISIHVLFADENDARQET